MPYRTKTCIENEERNIEQLDHMRMAISLNKLDKQEKLFNLRMTSREHIQEERMPHNSS